MLQVYESQIYLATFIEEKIAKLQKNSKNAKAREKIPQI
jgi:hypothetical protein